MPKFELVPGSIEYGETTEFLLGSETTRIDLRGSPDDSSLKVSRTITVEKTVKQCLAFSTAQNTQKSNSFTQSNKIFSSSQTKADLAAAGIQLENGLELTSAIAEEFRTSVERSILEQTDQTLSRQDSVTLEALSGKYHELVVEWRGIAQRCEATVVGHFSIIDLCRLAERGLGSLSLWNSFLTVLEEKFQGCLIPTMRKDLEDLRREGLRIERVGGTILRIIEYLMIINIHPHLTDKPKSTKELIEPRMDFWMPIRHPCSELRPELATKTCYYEPVFKLEFLVDFLQLQNIKFDIRTSSQETTGDTACI
jgi:hypothetical protein